jgi:hypothetical protein
MDTGDGILGTNMYAYCYNNPITYIDFGGKMAELAMAGAGAAGGAISVAGGMAAAGGANAWNPVGWVLLGAAAVTAAGVGIYFGVQYANDVALTNSINLMNFSSTAATPPPPNRGGKGTQVSSKTLYNKNGYRIDVENPGNRLGQIHVQADGKKYIYDVVNQTFRSTNGGSVPRAVIDLLKDPKAIRAIGKGLTILGY